MTQKQSQAGSSIARIMPAMADTRQGSRTRRLRQGFISNTPIRFRLLSCLLSIYEEISCFVPLPAAQKEGSPPKGRRHHREKIRKARPRRTRISTVPAGASLLTARESARSTVLSSSGYLAPRMVTPSSFSSMGIREKYR